MVDGSIFGESSHDRSTKQRYGEKDSGCAAQKKCGKNYILKVRIQFSAAR
jgi:hypothetical protein